MKKKMVTKQLAININNLRFTLRQIRGSALTVFFFLSHTRSTLAFETGGFLLLLELARRPDFLPSTFVLPLTLPASASGARSSFPRDFFILGIVHEHQLAGGAMLILAVVTWLDPSKLDWEPNLIALLLVVAFFLLDVQASTKAIKSSGGGDGATGNCSPTFLKSAAKLSIVIVIVVGCFGACC
jgi:hypothetical protein